jgi:hypothetical protein
MRNDQLWVPAAKPRSDAVPRWAEEDAGPVVPEDLAVPGTPGWEGVHRHNGGPEGFAEWLGASRPARTEEGSTEPGSGPSPPPGSVLDTGTGAAEGRRAFRTRRRAGSRAAAGRAAGRDAHGGETQTPVILVSRSQRLQDEVSRVAAAAGLDLEVVADTGSASGRNPEVLLLGIDAAGTELPGRFRHGGPERHRAETILVGTGEDTGLWEAAARLDSVRVAVLPAASGWLAEYLSRRRGLSAGYVLGVMGGCGGAGASSLSCWLAHEAAEQGVATLLVDGDPHGGGLDASLASGDIPGIRWPDLADVRGSLNPVQLVSALPQVSGFALLSGASGTKPGPAVPETAAAAAAADADLDNMREPAEESTRAVMDAARAGFALTVVDCARHRSGQLLSSCDAVLLVVPGRLRPVLAARTLHRSLGAVPQAVVVRGPLGDGLDDARAAGIVGLPLAGYLPAVRHLEHSEARGLLLERGRRASIRRLTGHLVRQLVSELPESALSNPGERP